MNNKKSSVMHLRPKIEVDRNIIFRGKSYPISFKIFNFYSQYFRNQDIKPKKDIIFECPSLISDSSFIYFINSCQNQDFKITLENGYDLLFLSEKYEVNLLEQAANDFIKKHQNLMIIQKLKYKINLQDDGRTCESNKDEEMIIGKNLNQYIGIQNNVDSLISLPTQSIFNILYYYYQNKKDSSNGNQTNILSFLLDVFKKKGRSASILFSLIDFKKENFTILQKIRQLELIDNINFDYSYLNQSFSSAYIGLVDENRVIKEESDNLINEMKDQINKIKDQMEFSFGATSSSQNNNSQSNSNDVPDLFEFDEEIDEANDHFDYSYYQETACKLLQNIDIDEIKDISQNDPQMKEKIILELSKLALKDALSDDKIEYLIDNICKSEEDIRKRDEMLFLLNHQNKLKNKFPELKNEVKFIKVPTDITTVNQAVFEGFPNVEKVELHDKVTNLLQINKNLRKLKEIIIIPLETGMSEILNSICMMRKNQSSQIGATIQFSKDLKCKVQFDNQYQMIELPNGLKFIPQNCFLNWTNLKEVKIPETVTRIEQGAFRNCTFLSEIKFPSSIVTIGKNAFEANKLIVSISFPNSLETIEEGAFKNCAALNNVHFNPDLKKIKSNAFVGCENLKDADISQCINIQCDENSFPNGCKVKRRVPKKP